MRFRKLRIAWSVFWGLACVLLTVLWVRSYWRHDSVQYYPTQAQLIYMASDAGVLAFGKGQVYVPIQLDSRWDFDSQPKSALPLEVYRASIAKKIFRGFDRDGNGHFAMPHWFPVSLMLVCAVVPWLAIQRFSLRTLLIATTLVAVMLGLIVWSVR